MNAFSIDIQIRGAPAARAYRGVLRDGRVAAVAAAHVESRHAIYAELPVHGECTIGAPIFNLDRRRSWTSRIPRGNWSCCDFGPRIGLAYRAGDSWRRFVRATE